MPETKIAAPVLAHRNGNKVVALDEPTTSILHPRAARRKARAKNILRTAAAFALRTLAVLAAVAALAALPAWACGAPPWPVLGHAAAAVALARAAGAADCREVQPCAEF